MFSQRYEDSITGRLWRLLITIMSMAALVLFVVEAYRFVLFIEIINNQIVQHAIVFFCFCFCKR